MVEDPRKGNDYLTRQLQDMAPHRAILRAVECHFMGQVSLVRPVLDVGCGDGHFASIAYRDLPIDVGIDVMARDLPEAAARRVEEPLQREVYRQVMFASATALPFPDGAFNTVVSNCVIEHIPDNDAVLREISRVLRGGGTFATTLPSEHYAEFLLGSTAFRKLGIKPLAEGYGRFFNQISHHYHVYPPEVWKERLARVGLEVVEQTYYFSDAAHRRFDLSHYLGVPQLFTKRLFGRWVLPGRPGKWQSGLFERWLRPYYEEPLPAEGAYQFVRCQRTSSEGRKP